MNKNDIRIAVAQLNSVADKLESKDKQNSEKIRVYAQALSEMMGNGFNPSMEYGSLGDSQDVQPFANDKSPVNMETTIDGQTEKVPIESFVRQPDQPAPANYKIHTCTVTFKAPLDVEESDMMNYILGIGEKLGVDVDSFKWAKADANKAQGK